MPVVEPPVSVTVKVFVELVAVMFVFEKVYEAGVIDSAPIAMPSPVKETLKSPPGLADTSRLADLLPGLCGAKVTNTVQSAAGSSVAPGSRPRS